MYAFAFYKWHKKQKPDGKVRLYKFFLLTLWFFFEANVLSV